MQLKVNVPESMYQNFLTQKTGGVFDRLADIEVTARGRGWTRTIEVNEVEARQLLDVAFEAAVTKGRDREMVPSCIAARALRDRLAKALGVDVPVRRRTKKADNADEGEAPASDASAESAESGSEDTSAAPESESLTEEDFEMELDFDFNNEVETEGDLSLDELQDQEDSEDEGEDEGHLGGLGYGL